ncbi:MAG: aconitase family protein [Ottowia sp.]|uniref:3-isopropylmalate dehydratase large subunit n=1 Tax=Ottowia sp. TaxID=1898956 RepID=UPI003C7426EC
MGHTLTEKIFARAAGLPAVNAGDELMVRPDFVLAYDFSMTTTMFFRQMKEFKVDTVADPGRYGIFIDHFVPSNNAAAEALHEETRGWCDTNNVDIYDRKGIGHQVAAEEGYATPGALIMHHDGHISQLGAYGALAFGVRRHLIESFVRDKVSMQVPETVRVDVEGTLGKGVMARDVFHHIVRVLGPSSCNFKVVEFGGSAIEAMSVDALQTMTGLAMFLGAASAVVNPTGKVLAIALERARKQIEPMTSDPDARYSARHTINIDGLEPIVVVPPHLHDTQPLKNHVGLPLNSGYIGSCAGGRLEELEIAARVLRGRKVRKGFSLNVVPSSQVIMKQAAERGFIADLIEAGAFVAGPTCDFCYGYQGALKAGQRVASTGTLNTPGRMGSVDSEIYLVNAATVAASAIEGCLALPQPYL